MRIVSLVASATEIVCALDAGEMLVGRSHECDNPAWVRNLPKCSEPAFDITVSSREIDAEVKRRVRAGEPLYQVDSDRIRELHADLILAQSHCEVCAVTPGDVHAPSIRCEALSAASLDGVFESVMQVARMLDREDMGRAVVERERRLLAEIRSRTDGLPRRTVVMIEWIDPLFSMGNWGPELVEIAGGEPLIGTPGEFSVGIEFEQVTAADPEFVIVAPCGFSLDRAWTERSVLRAYPGWGDLRAVREGRVALADGNLFFNRAGMTMAPTAALVAEILHDVGSAYRGYWRWLG
jgi:iron complex transport system substrate-binding protein